MDDGQADARAWRDQTLQARRMRLIEAMIAVVCDGGGFAGSSVAKICGRADLSRRAFYESFASRESCFLAVLDEGYRRVTELVSQALEQAGSWQEAVRQAHVAMLTFFDSEPQLARMCVVESLAAGPWALERRERHVADLRRLIVAYLDPPGEPYPFASDGVMASSLATVQNHLLAGGKAPFIGLLGPLMGMAVAPYLDSREVEEEVACSSALARKLLASQPAKPPLQVEDEEQEKVEVPDLLLDPRARRARGCILYLAEHPGASNRQIARAVGIARDTQISTLLARLVKAGILHKRKPTRGGANAWSLTSQGRHVARALVGRARRDEKR